jgi:hypothetical protein
MRISLGRNIVMVGMSQVADEERGSQERVNFQAWQCSFLPGLFLLIAVLPAQSQEVPVLNVEPVCRGIAQQASDPSEKGGPERITIGPLNTLPGLFLALERRDAPFR